MDTVYTLDTTVGVWRVAEIPMPIALQDSNAVAITNTTAMLCGGYNAVKFVQAACYTLHVYSSFTDLL